MFPFPCLPFFLYPLPAYPALPPQTRAALYCDPSWPTKWAGMASHLPLRRW